MIIKLNKIRKIKHHKAILIDRNSLYTVYQNKIYRFDTSGKKRLISVLKLSGTDRIISKFSILRRVFRYGISCCCKTSHNHCLFGDKKYIYNINILNGNVAIEKKLTNGFRPMSFCNIQSIKGFRDTICYGEYGANAKKRKEVSIFCRKTSGQWECVFTFPSGKIEHIHSLVADPYRDCVWIFTGDYGSGAGIWVAHNDFKVVECVLRGNQNYRASTGYPLPDGLVYATDTHISKNSIRMLINKQGCWASEQLRDMPASSIYSSKIQNIYFFSTAFEPGAPSGNFILDYFSNAPGPGISINSCELIAWIPNQGFIKPLSWRVDHLPKRIFQFSSVSFPSINQADGSWIAIYGLGCVGFNDCTLVYEIITS